MSYPFSELLTGSSQTQKGPQRKFGPFHYYKALKEIWASGRTGRARISNLLGIGEGSTRTLLDELESASYISRSNAGIVLTAKGTAFMEGFPLRLAPMQHSSLSTGAHSTIAVAEGRGGHVTNGIAQRDAAIKSGGDGAITIIVRNGRLILPPDYIMVKDTAIKSAAFSELRARDGDAVIIASGSTAILSETAAFFAAMTLLE